MKETSIRDEADNRSTLQMRRYKQTNFWDPPTLLVNSEHWIQTHTAHTAASSYPFARAVDVIGFCWLA